MYWLIPLALAATLAGCSSQPTAQQAPASPKPVATPAIAHKPSKPAPKLKVSRETSDFPDGTYRTHLTLQELIDLGAYGFAGGPQGMWTLTVKSGKFEIHCRPVEDPAADCGNAGLPNLKVNTLIQTGSVRGRHPLLWFIADNLAKSRLTGCVRDSDEPNGCGQNDIFHVNWRRVPGGIAFSLFGEGTEPGSPEVETWTAKPWVRIS